jgi:hypothetical protein
MIVLIEKRAIDSDDCRVVAEGSFSLYPEHFADDDHP